MRKYVIHTRTIPGRPKEESPCYLIEVEGEIITALEDPSVLFLPNGEFRFKIISPKFLHDSYGPPTYHSHSVYANVDLARAEAERLMFQELEFARRKYKTEYSQEDLENKISKIEEIPL